MQGGRGLQSECGEYVKWTVTRPQLRNRVSSFFLLFSLFYGFLSQVVEKVIARLEARLAQRGEDAATIASAGDVDKVRLWQRARGNVA